MLGGLECLEPATLAGALNEGEARQLAPEISFGELFEESTSKRGTVKYLAAFTDSMAVIGGMLRRQREDLDNQRRKALAGFEQLCEQTRQGMQQQLLPGSAPDDQDHYDRVARLLRRFDRLYPRARQYHAGVDVHSRRRFGDAYYQLCLVILYFQRYVALRARREARQRHAQARGLRGLFRRRSAGREHRRLGRGLAHIRKAILWFQEQRKQMETLFRKVPGKAQPARRKTGERTGVDTLIMSGAALLGIGE
jgi:hypothetical protein